MGLLSGVSSALGYDGKTAQGATIRIGKYTITGWERVSIRIGLEIMPWAAMLETSSWQPTASGGSTLSINEGDACSILIGKDQVLTGYVQSIAEDIGPEEHSLRIIATSKSVDAVECSALFSTYQMNNTTVLGIAQQVCQQAGIQVRSIGGAGETNIQQFSVILTETAYEVIERATRLAGCLFYDQPDGSIVLAPLGTKNVGCLTMGKNIERMSVLRSLSGRYSNVQAIIQNMAVLFSPPVDGNKQAQQMQVQTAPVQASANDSGVKRPRTLLIPIELGDKDNVIARQRVQWEVARRYGRSQVVEITSDSWRDSNGHLWQPNTLCTVSRPQTGFKKELLIAEIEFVQGEGGTHANLVLMPPQAFKPEPLLLPMAQKEGVVATTGNN